VLIVDDDPTVLSELIRGMRDELERWDPIFALGGPAGIDVLRAMEFDVIISDLDMPIENGLAVLEAARVHRSTAVRILMAGSSGEPRGDRDGHVVIAKPFTVEHLRAALATMDQSLS
jgi:DNA-binding response OmpR family regulator